MCSRLVHDLGTKVLQNDCHLVFASFLSSCRLAWQQTFDTAARLDVYDTVAHEVYATKDVSHREARRRNIVEHPDCVAG